MSVISKIIARQILDSKGFPTVEADVITSNGIIGRASVPSGTTTGKYEAQELRDKDKGRYVGKGVLKAVYNINKTINDELNGLHIANQSVIDQVMINIDGTANKSKIGANAILSVSIAAAKAAAISTGQSLYRYIGGVFASTMPIPLINIVNGGINSENDIDFLEFMIMPINADTFSDAFRMGTEVYIHFKELLKQNGHSINVCDEAGFTPDLKTNEKTLEFLIKSIEKAGYKAGKDIYIAIDAAASQLYKTSDSKYYFKKGKKILTTDELINYWIKLLNKYPIVSVEDPLDQDDWEGWKKLNKIIGNNVQVAGDDIFATNTSRLAKGILEQAANCIIVKPNQIGTLTETINTVQLAAKWGFNAIISHRAGETEDTYLAELAVALNTGLIKFGSPCHSEHTAKYNQLIRIEEELGPSARYYGREFKYLR